MPVSYAMLAQQLSDAHVAYQRLRESNTFLTECNARQAAEIVTLYKQVESLEGHIYELNEVLDEQVLCE